MEFVIFLCVMPFVFPATFFVIELIDLAFFKLFGNPSDDIEKNPDVTCDPGFIWGCDGKGYINNKCVTDTNI